ncbi:MAG: hypothetical protein FJW34_08770 [Acidobacteria bacterium]|nr:hypothetical protein [Acidobacteriota bacterium]
MDTSPTRAAVSVAAWRTWETSPAICCCCCCCRCCSSASLRASASARETASVLAWPTAMAAWRRAASSSSRKVSRWRRLVAVVTEDASRMAASSAEALARNLASSPASLSTRTNR